MKRAAALLILMLYVISVSGASFNVHFCGKKFQKISFSGFESSGCCCEGKMKMKKKRSCCAKAKKKKKCCEDKVISFKAAEKHKNSEIAVLPVSVPKAIALEQPVFLCIGKIISTFSVAPNFHSPPIRGGDTGLFIRYGILRI